MPSFWKQGGRTASSIPALRDLWVVSSLLFLGHTTEVDWAYPSKMVAKCFTATSNQASTTFRFVSHPFSLLKRMCSSVFRLSFVIFLCLAFAPISIPIQPDGLMWHLQIGFTAVCVLIVSVSSGTDHSLHCQQNSTTSCKLSSTASRFIEYVMIQWEPRSFSVRSSITLNRNLRKM